MDSEFHLTHLIISPFQNPNFITSAKSFFLPCKALESQGLETGTCTSYEDHYPTNHKDYTYGNMASFSQQTNKNISSTHNTFLLFFQFFCKVKIAIFDLFPPIPIFFSIVFKKDFIHYEYGKNSLKVTDELHVVKFHLQFLVFILLNFPERRMWPVDNSLSVLRVRNATLLVLFQPLSSLIIFCELFLIFSAST